MSKNTKSVKASKPAKAAKVTTPKVTTEKGTWQDDLATSSVLRSKSDKDRKRSSALLWDGAKAGIEAWDSSDDPSAEQFSDEVNSVLGEGRKGDASKIKTVALAVANNGLNLDEFPNLAKAYAEATRLTKTVKVEKSEDEAADEVISALDVPKTASSGEAAAKIVLGKGVDEAARLLLDVLGDQNFDAHRSLLRALTQETTGRVKASKEAEKTKVADAPKKGAEQASKAKAQPKVQPASAKAKVVAKPKGAPVKVEADDAQGTLPVAPSDKGEPVEGKPVEGKPAVKAKPVVKKPVVKGKIARPVVAKK